MCLPVPKDSQAEVGLVGPGDGLGVHVVEIQKLIVIIILIFPFNAGQLCLLVHHEDHPLAPYEDNTIQALLRIFDIHDGETVMHDFLFPRVEGNGADDSMQLIFIFDDPGYPLLGPNY